MPLQSLKITRQELTNYYDPKSGEYEYMVNSINSSMGYGQVIQNYIGTEVIGTYFHIYSYGLNEPVVYYPTTGVEVPEAEAGPTFWGVSAVQGLNFLNGTSSISGYRKLKYCNACSDGNGLDKPVIENFKQRFTQVKELVFNYNLLDGYLFYDLEMPRYQNVFPSVKIDDGVNINYQFKDVSNGADLTLEQVSLITSKSVLEIESSIDTAPIIKPQEGANSVILSCCDDRTYYVAEGQLGVGTIVTTGELPESVCWYVESYTNDSTTTPPGVIFSSGERSCASCTRNNPCGGTPTSSIISDCCGLRLTYIIDGVYSIGTVLYTKDVDPALCFEVIHNTSDSPDNFYRYDEFGRDCAECTGTYPCGK